VLGDTTSGVYWTNEDTGDITWETPEDDTKCAEEVAHLIEDASGRDLYVNIQNSMDKEIVFYKLELLKKSLHELEQLNGIDDTALILEILKDGHRKAVEEGDVFVEDSPEESKNEYVGGEGGIEPNVQGENVLPPGAKKIKERPPLITEVSFVEAQYDPHPEIELKVEEIPQVEEPPPNPTKEEVPEIQEKKNNDPPVVDLKFTVDVAPVEDDVPTKEADVMEIVDAISTVGIVEEGEVYVDTLVSHLVADGYVAYRDNTTYDVQASASQRPHFQPSEKRFVKRELSCISTLIEACDSCEKSNVENVNSVPELEDKLADRRRKLQIDLARSQKEAMERKERARQLQEEQLRKTTSSGESKSTPNTHRTQVWCKDLRNIVSRDLRAECSVTEENEGILVSISTQNFPPSLNEEEVTKYMTKLAIAGYPYKHRLRLCPARWGVVQSPDSATNCPGTLNYVFFVPRVVLSRTKLPPSHPSSRVDDVILSQSAPANLIGEPQTSVLTMGSANERMRSGHKGGRKSRAKKLKPMRNIKTPTSKNGLVNTVHVAPGYCRFEQNR
jgi:hypothetical protein